MDSGTIGLLVSPVLGDFLAITDTESLDSGGGFGVLVWLISGSVGAGVIDVGVDVGVCVGT
jgi:hypothetical protein